MKWFIKNKKGLIAGLVFGIFIAPFCMSSNKFELFGSKFKRVLSQI